MKPRKDSQCGIKKKKKVSFTESAWLLAICPETWVKKEGTNQKPSPTSWVDMGQLPTSPESIKIPEKSVRTSPVGEPPPSNGGRQVRLRQKWGNLLLPYLALLKNLSALRWKFPCLIAGPGGEKIFEDVLGLCKYILTLKFSACPKSSSLLNNLFYLGEGVSFCILFVSKKTQIICD